MTSGTMLGIMLEGRRHQTKAAPENRLSIPRSKLEGGPQQLGHPTLQMMGSAHRRRNLRHNAKTLTTVGF